MTSVMRLRRHSPEVITAQTPLDGALGLDHDGKVAMLLLPYPAGKVEPALAGTKLVAQPMLMQVQVKDAPAWLDLMVAQIVRSWLHWTPDGWSVVAAPPVLEMLRAGRLHERRLFDCGLSWPLPPPDGLSPPQRSSRGAEQRPGPGSKFA
jgi:hypothetical protein